MREKRANWKVDAHRQIPDCGDDSDTENEATRKIPLKCQRTKQDKAISIEHHGNLVWEKASNVLRDRIVSSWKRNQSGPFRRGK